MAKEALLLVDVQNDFCPGGSLAVPNGDAVIDPLNQLVDHARAHEWTIVASRDWHPEKTSHFDTWPAHCVKGTEGAEFHPKLDTKDVTVFSKGMGSQEDAYSAFDARLADDTKLEKYLKERNVTELYVGGLATDYCVKASAIDGASLGFRTFLLYDATRAVDVHTGDGDKAITEMQNAGVTLTTTEAVISTIE